MSFFELFDQFFQLNDQQPIKPLASKLYMYWLHGFNKARWPVLLYRRANQVFTDLGCDKNTLAVAVCQLEARGLLAYVSGQNGKAGQWFLNYEPATPEWVGKVKNSPSETPVTAATEVKNSPSIYTRQPDSANSEVNFSPPIRNRQDNVLLQDQPHPFAGEGVGAAAEEITLALLPTEKKQLVPPIAEPPHAGQPGPVAAAELPEALAAEAKALAGTIGAVWSITEMRNFSKWALIAAFTKRQAQLGRLPEVQQQFAAYKLAHLRPGIRPHKLENWLGHPDDDYQRGEWCGCDWAGVAAHVQAAPRPGYGPEPTPARAGGGTSNKQKNW